MIWGSVILWKFCSFWVLNSLNYVVGVILFQFSSMFYCSPCFWVVYIFLDCFPLPFLLLQVSKFSSPNICIGMKFQKFLSDTVFFLIVTVYFMFFLGFCFWNLCLVSLKWQYNFVFSLALDYGSFWISSFAPLPGLAFLHGSTNLDSPCPQIFMLLC